MAGPGARSNWSAVWNAKIDGRKEKRAWLARSLGARIELVRVPPGYLSGQGL
jgi:hypothetical protein